MSYNRGAAVVLPAVTGLRGFGGHWFDCGGSGEEDEHLKEWSPRGSDGWRALGCGTSDPWDPQVSDQREEGFVRWAAWVASLGGPK